MKDALKTLVSVANLVGLVVIAVWVEAVKDEHQEQIIAIQREMMDRVNPSGGWRKGVTEKLDRILDQTKGQ